MEKLIHYSKFKTWKEYVAAGFKCGGCTCSNDYRNGVGHGENCAAFQHLKKLSDTYFAERAEERRKKGGY